VVDLGLKYQEKYFSKYEGTYFTDKKCSENWVNDYYLQGEVVFKSNLIENFFNNQSTFFNKNLSYYDFTNIPKFN